MQKITVEITAQGYTGLAAENIEKALNHYFGAPTLKVSFSVTEAAQQSAQADGGGVCPLCGDKLFCAMCGEHVCP